MDISKDIYLEVSDIKYISDLAQYVMDGELPKFMFPGDCEEGIFDIYGFSPCDSEDYKNAINILLKYINYINSESYSLRDSLGVALGMLGGIDSTLNRFSALEKLKESYFKA